jgi:sugar (pentulose or hexulose) kinase
MTNFKSHDALKSVERVVNEAAEALGDKKRTIVSSAIPDIVAAATGAGIGTGISFAALFYAGTTGLSAVGITTALAAAGKLVGGGMVAGIGVLAAPVAVLAVGGYAVASRVRTKKLREEKERVLKLAIERQFGINAALSEEVNATKERVEYLTGINILLQAAIRDLREDIS